MLIIAQVIHDIFIDVCVYAHKGTISEQVPGKEKKDHLEQ